MHIPDGYLGPQTYVGTYAVMAPLWAVASRKLGRILRTRQVPLLALGSAFSFIVMMFNVPIPGGTTGHAVGAVLVAVLLGPWAACVAVSIALVVQALMFGDGGLTAIGANCLNMAVIMPFTGWWVYQRLSRGTPEGSRWRCVAAAAGGYVGVNAAALATAVLLGLQPALARDLAGHALYCPYPLRVAVPVMALEHLLVFGWVEALVTGLVVAYLQRQAPETLPAAEALPSRRNYRALWTALVAVALLTPLGLLLPQWLKAGGAWGEWSASEVGEQVGYIPRQLERLEGLWRSPLGGYALGGHGSLLFYVVCAVLGLVLVAVVGLLVGRALASAPPKAPPAPRPAPAPVEPEPPLPGKRRRRRRKVKRDLATAVPGQLPVGDEAAPRQRRRRRGPLLEEDVPAWLAPAAPLTSEQTVPVLTVGRTWRRGLDRLQHALTEQLAPPRPGWLTACDARPKLLGVLVLVVTVSLLQEVATLWAAMVVGLIIALTARVSWQRLGPLWLGVPLFSLVLALPAMLNVLTPGEPALVIARLPWQSFGPWLLPPQLTVTVPGLLVGGRLLLRATACVILALVLTATTEPTALLKGLRSLGLPRVLAMVLLMMHRYLGALLRAAEDLHRARLSRTIAPESVRQGQAFAATGIGLMLLRSLRLAEGVHQAMVARGYEGEVHTLADRRLGWREALVLALFVVLAAALAAADHLLT